jgi:hypothetical protein
VQAAITVAGKTLPQQMSIPRSYKKVNPADSPILILAAQSDTLPLAVVDDYADNFLASRSPRCAALPRFSSGANSIPRSAFRFDAEIAKAQRAGRRLVSGYRGGASGCHNL